MAGDRGFAATTFLAVCPIVFASQIMLGWPWMMMALTWMQVSRGFSIVKNIASNKIIGWRPSGRIGACYHQNAFGEYYPRTPKTVRARWFYSTTTCCYFLQEKNHLVAAEDNMLSDSTDMSSLPALLQIKDTAALAVNDEPNTTTLGLEDEIAARKLAENWTNHPDIHQTIHFQSWQVQDGRHIQSILNDAEPYLASRLDLLQHTNRQRRIKIVQNLNKDVPKDDDSSMDSKIILIHPDAPPLSDLLPNATDALAYLIQGGAITQGPIVPVTFTYQDFSVSYILTRLLPPEVHPVPTAFETVGHVAHYNFKRHHLPYRFLIAAVVLSQLSMISTVIHKVGTVQGPYRTYQYELLAGEDRLYVTHTEASCKFQFDITEVYWCSRLSEERHRLVQKEFQHNQTIADAFCGVGALCIQAARAKSCQILANDWNAAAVKALQHNARLNHVTIKSITEMDAYKFLVDLGVKQSVLPHHVVMNYPLEAPKFLGALRWWPTNSNIDPRIHVYTFCESVEHALQQVAEALFPMTDASMLDEFPSCKVKVHMVRDVTPNTTVACVSFSATSELLKVVQGDFS